MRAIFLFLFFSISIRLAAQSCDCPALTSCGTCEGGLVSLKLRFTGSTPQAVTAADQINTVFSGTVNPGETFSFVGSIPNEKFVGPNISMTVAGTPNATIPSICGSVFVGNVYGSFVIVEANSKSGGPVCCSAASMETVPPQITACPANMTVSLPASSCSVPGGWAAPQASDNCAITSFTSTHEPTDLLPVGVTEVTYTAIDKYGNVSTCAFSVTVTDNIAPVFSNCPPDITLEATNSCQAPVSWAPPTASDNCSASMSASHAPGTVFAIGTTTVTYTATDPAGNSTTCSFNVLVRDTTAPVITGCLSDISITSQGCDGVATWTTPGTSDNCSATLSSTHEPGSTFPLGSTTVTYTSTDPAGNKSNCSFKVIVTTSGAPVVKECPDDIVTHTFDASTAIDWAPPQATAICGELLSNVSHQPGMEFTPGVTTVTYEFSDGTGNKSACTFDISIIKDELSIEVSKVVTPNGDGVNDTWWVTNIEKFKENTVVVVDRWGNKIYESKGYDNVVVHWTGVGPGGGRVPVGTYFYTIEAHANDSVVRDSGFVEVIY